MMPAQPPLLTHLPRPLLPQPHPRSLSSLPAEPPAALPALSPAAPLATTSSLVYFQPQTLQPHLHHAHPHSLHPHPAHLPPAAAESGVSDAVGTEHILLVLLDDHGVGYMLEKLEIDVPGLRAEVGG